MPYRVSPFIFIFKTGIKYWEVEEKKNKHFLSQVHFIIQCYELGFETWALGIEV